MSQKGHIHPEVVHKVYVPNVRCMKSLYLLIFLYENRVDMVDR